ncbi:MAG TPA: hypothetical protein VEY11_19750 [Pyrinomonadaceae bacterium]|nr:hypothetical protein [Pyrinomonadaceae bacterium]
MIFSVQRYLEDYFESLGLRDVDQYAVKLANVYSTLSPDSKDADALSSIHRIRTVFFRNNYDIERSEFESRVLALLNRQFKKKDWVEEFPGGLKNEKRKLSRTRRRTIKLLLELFQGNVEARLIDGFWQSRKQNKLAKKPEKRAQDLLESFLLALIPRGSGGLVLSEFNSGIGFVDVGVYFSSTLHIIELKVLRSKFVGVSQLQTYMKNEGRKEGWLVVFDARPVSKRDPIPKSLSTSDGVVKVIVVDINPTAPSAKKA